MFLVRTIHKCRYNCENSIANHKQEALRLKIIARLNSEGSNAEVPLNVPLSDYSSDEGQSDGGGDDEDVSIHNNDLNNGYDSDGGVRLNGYSKSRGRKLTEGYCCSNTIKVPPTSPELGIAQRFRSKLMKVIFKIDCVYVFFSVHVHVWVFVRPSAVIRSADGRKTGDYLVRHK